jgi:hyaluronoglucosaminidase
MTNNFAVRGVIEGFYGRPWSHAERLSMLEFMAGHGFNYYAHAPKNDPLHRNRWREPYLRAELEDFAALHSRAAELEIEFAYGLTPLEFHYSDPADYAALLKKFRAVQTLGISSFVLLLDDIPDAFRYPEDAAQFSSLGAAQAWLCNRLLHDLGSARLAFTPTQYHGDGGSTYLRDLGAALEGRIDVHWTGPDICSRTITTPHLETVASSLGRLPLVWDNYPVNDLDMRFDPHLRPYMGRDATLGRACRGIIVNAALQAEASKIAVHTAAAYMRQPALYDPERAWLEALDAVCARPAGATGRSPQRVDGNPSDAEAVAHLARFSRTSALEDGALDPDLEVQINALTLETLPGFTAELEGITRALETLGNTALRADLEPWTSKLRGWLETLGLAATGDERATLERLSLTRENFHRVAGDLFDQTARRIVREVNRG